MISNEQIKKCISDCLKAGHTIGLRDISYVLLCKQLDDNAVAYKALFGNDVDYNAEYVHTYDQTSAMSFLKIYAEQSFVDVTQKKKKKVYEDITFDENKAYMIKLRKDTEIAIENGEIDKTAGHKILSDISCKLNDKFNISDTSHEQLIFVNAKYDAICPRCGVEVARRPISKEEAMDMYDLVEKE